MGGAGVRELGRGRESYSFVPTLVARGYIYFSSLYYAKHTLSQGAVFIIYDQRSAGLRF